MLGSIWANTSAAAQMNVGYVCVRERVGGIELVYRKKGSDLQKW